ncbi:MAG: NAD(+) synthase [Bacteroidetes bacterium]|nr:NAD(+) synthase [Bacteroidota bacterium]
MKKYNLLKYNYLPIQIIAPEIKIANIEYNTEVIISEINKHSKETNLIIFPELVLTGSSCGDLFFSSDLINKIPNALTKIVHETKKNGVNVILGTPFLLNNKLYNVAVFISNGKVLGIVPKNLKTRWFSDYTNIDDEYTEILFDDYFVPFDDKLVFNCDNLSDCKIMIHIGQPTIKSYYNLLGAQVIVNLNTLPYSIEQNSEDLIKQISKLNNQGIIYVNSNASESTTDNVYGNTILVCEAGNVVNKETTLQLETQTLKSELDLDIINSLQRKESCSDINYYSIDFNLKSINSELSRSVIQSPYFNNCNTDDLIKKCNNILEIQALGLAKRISSINVKNLVIGISGGVDSTLALLAAIRTCDILGISRKNIFTIMMPGFATTSKTKNNSYKLAELLGTNIIKIPIVKAVTQHLKDIDHNINDTNVVYENAQARMRSMILFDYANKVGGIVVGTGDASEIALGWSTYNGDHISNYNVNAGIPKSIAQAIIRVFAENEIKNGEREIGNVLLSILSTPISPELVGNSGKSITQETEKILGPYILHDFFIWYYCKYHLSQEKIVFLASIAFSDIKKEDILKYLKLFFKRFYQNQYKRSCSTDGPAVFDFSLSPRTGLILPSDISYNI